MIEIGAMIRMADGVTEQPVSTLKKGDQVFNPVTGRSSTVSTILFRTLAFDHKSPFTRTKLRPIRFDPGSINKRFPEVTLWLTQTAKVLHVAKSETCALSKVEVRKAIDLAGLPGVSIDDHLPQAIFARIILAESGLIAVSGLVIEADSFSVFSRDVETLDPRSMASLQGHQMSGRMH